MAQLQPKHIDTELSEYLVSATPPTILETVEVFLSRSEDVHDVWL